jgi:hypothetical protein
MGEAAKVGVEELGVVDQADQVIGGVVQRDANEGAEGIVSGGRWRFNFARAVDLTKVVGVGI